MATLALAKALKKKRISKRQFAIRLGMRYENVFKLFRNGRNPKLSTLNKWAKIIGCRVRDLLEE
jgi:transcriptional regulator with XRE-family HTH domain